MLVYVCVPINLSISWFNKDINKINITFAQSPHTLARCRINALYIINFSILKQRIYNFQLKPTMRKLKSRTLRSYYLVGNNSFPHKSKPLSILFFSSHIVRKRMCSLDISFSAQYNVNNVGHFLSYIYSNTTREDVPKLDTIHTSIKLPRTRINNKNQARIYQALCWACKNVFSDK